MPSEIRKIPVDRGIEHIGFVVRPEAERGELLDSVLVHFRDEKPENWWRDSVAGNKKAAAFSFYCHLFILCVRAYQVLTGTKRWSHEVDEGGGRWRALLQYGDPIYGDLHEPTVRHWWTVRHDGESREKNEYIAYHGIPRELRAAVWGVYPVIGDKNLARIELRPREPGMFHFWRRADVPLEVLTALRRETVRWAWGDSPPNSVEPELLDGLAKRLATSRPWERPGAPPHGVRTTRAGKRDAIESIRRRLRVSALNALKWQLQSDDPDEYIQLTLELGGRAKVASQRQQQEANSTPPPLDLGYEWCPFDIRDLLPPTRSYFVTGPLGAGKTTFLRFLQNKLLSQESVLAFYLRAGKIPESALVGWSQLWRFLLEPMEDELSAAEIASSLETARGHARIVLLIDGLDDLGIADARCFTPLNDLIRVSKNTGAVFAGRPSAAGWPLIQRDSSLLRIKELSPNDQATFFGGKYEQAIASCRGRRELLATPMHAYIVRKLVREDWHDEIGSLWDLYRRFLRYVFSEHPSNSQREDHYRWARRVRQMLQQVCYQAIDQDIPEWKVISERTFALLPARIVDRLQELISVGLVDLVYVDATAAGRSLVFRHDCFQEALAAEWALASKKRGDHVLHEYWNPKWKGVITLMACAKPEMVLERLYPGSDADDPIHSRLFLAAECAGQAPAIGHVAERRIVANLRELVSHVLFGDAALVGLVKLGGTLAHETAWDAITRDEGHDKGRSWRLDLMDLQPLYTPTRLAHLVRSVRHGRPLSYLAHEAFISWLPRVSSKLARRLLYTDWRRCSRGFPLPLALTLRLELVDFGWTLLDAFAPDVSSPDPLAVLDRVFEMGFQPSAPQIDLLIERAPESGSCSVARALNVVAAALSDDHMAHIDRRWWVERRHSRIRLMASAPRVCAKLPNRWIHELVDAVGSDDEALRRDASAALAECGDRLGAAQLETIMSRARQEAPDANVLNLVVTVKQDIGADLAHNVLDAIGAQDRDVRLVALKSVEKLRSYVLARHVELLESTARQAVERVFSTRGFGTLQNREERAYAIQAIASIGERVRKSTISYILDTLDVEKATLHGGLGPTLSRLAQHVTAEQLHELVGRVCSGLEAGKRTIEHQYCPLFVPGRLEKRDIVCLAQLFRVSTSPDLLPVLDALRAMHENGDLSAIDWSADKPVPSREK